jgi:hypothetical protein
MKQSGNSGCNEKKFCKQSPHCLSTTDLCSDRCTHKVGYNILVSLILTIHLVLNASVSL